MDTSNLCLTGSSDDLRIEQISSDIPYGNQRPYAEKIMRRLKGTNGLIIRGIDLRHLPKYINQQVYFETRFQMPRNYIDYMERLQLEPTAFEFNTKEREELVISEPFRLNSFDVPYSIGKHKRWQLNEFFEENREKFQHPFQNISTVMVTSDCLYDSRQSFNVQCQPLVNGIQTPFRVKRIVTGKVNGKLSIKETKNGRALLRDLLKPVEPIPKPTRKQPKHKKAARRFRRREMLRKRNECQEDPIRLTYFVSESRPTWKQYESEVLSQSFGYGCVYRMNFQKGRSRLIQPEDFEYYEDSLDFDECSQLEEELIEDNNDSQSDYVHGKPRGFSLADYIIDDEDDVSTFIYFSLSNSMENLNVDEESRRNSTDSYEMIDLV